MGIYDRIKIKADEKNISIKALERESGLGNGVIKRWNNTSPQCNKLEKVANYLQTSIEWLITGKENNNLSNEEKDLIKNYRELSEKNKGKVEGYIYGLANSDNSENEEKEKLSNSKIG